MEDVPDQTDQPKLLPMIWRGVQMIVAIWVGLLASTIAFVCCCTGTTIAGFALTPFTAGIAGEAVTLTLAFGMGFAGAGVALYGVIRALWPARGPAASRETRFQPPPLPSEDR